jgi:hypothetical protein
VLERGLVDVDDRELAGGELRRGGVDCVALREADADDQVVLLAREARHVRDVVGRGGGLQHTALDPELPLGPLETLVGELVEAAVVQLTDVGDQPHLERLRRGRLSRRCGAGLLAVAAAAGGEREEACEQRSDGCESCRQEVFDC